MRVGIIILPDERWSTARRRWQLAEQYGFDHAWTYDHIGWRDLVNGPWFDAVPTLTAAAQVTSRIRLGTMVASANFRHPVHFAREITALDDISDGRFTLGVGAGGSGFDEAVLGREALSLGDRVGRFAEFVELLDLILRTDTATDAGTAADAATDTDTASGAAADSGAGSGVTWQGRWYSAAGARANPGCVQRPRVPFVLAANGPRSMRQVARFGQGWVTSGEKTDDLATWWRLVGDTAARFDEVLDAAGREPSSVERHLSLDAAPVFSLASVDAFADAVGQAGELGFTHAHTHWPRRDSWYGGDEAILERVAAEVLPTL